MSIHEFHNTLQATTEGTRSFKQLRELGVDVLRHTGRNWEPWAKSGT